MFVRSFVHPPLFQTWESTFHLSGMFAVNSTLYMRTWSKIIICSEKPAFCTNMLTFRGILMQEYALSLCLSSVVCGRHTFCWRCECSRWPSPSPPPRKEGKLSTNELPPLLLSSLLPLSPSFWRRCAEWVCFFVLLRSQRHFCLRLLSLLTVSLSLRRSDIVHLPSRQRGKEQA